MLRDLEYETSNKIYNKYTEETEIKCKNYEVCKETLPEWWFDRKGTYICMNCDMLFGTWSSGSYVQKGKGVLGVFDNLKCPICFETKKSTSYPNCDHTVCIDCFRRCWYRDESKYPPFPYPDAIEDEYDENGGEDPQWRQKYPLIEQWEKDQENWEDSYPPEHLRKCPLCRK